MNMNAEESDSEEIPIDENNINPNFDRRWIWKGINYLISKALINYIDYIVRAIAIFDLIICFIVIIFAVFMAIQQGKLIKVSMTPLMWTALIIEILGSILLIALLWYIVKKWFKLPAFTYYIVLRILIIFLSKSLSISNNIL